MLIDSQLDTIEPVVTQCLGGKPRLEQHKIPRPVMTELNILLLAPPLNEKSAGIVALYRLYNELYRIDETTQILVYQGFGNNFSVIVEDVSVEPEEFGEIFPNSIFIIPEVLCASRLLGLRIARYYLNRLGAITPAKADTKSEFAIAFNKAFCQNCHFHLPIYLGKADIPVSFEATQEHSRPINLTYFGKTSAKYQGTAPLPSSLLIDRNWPESSDHYLELLGISEYFFTFDCISSTNTDAALAGAKVVILDFSPYGEEYFQSCKPGPYLTAQNYNSESATQKYVTELNKWINDARNRQEKFPDKVSLLRLSLLQFFN